MNNIKEIENLATKYAEYTGIINNPANQSSLKEAFMAGAKSQNMSDWVSVEDAELSSGQEVLFVYKGFTHSGYFEANEGSEMFSTNSGITAHKTEVEWYMPLPPPHKTDK